MPAITERCDSVPVSSRGEVSVPRESPVYSNFPAAARAVPCVSVPRRSPVYSNHDGSMAACGSMEGNQSFSPTGIAGVLQLGGVYLTELGAFQSHGNCRCTPTPPRTSLSWARFSPTGIAGVLQLIKVKRVPGRVSVPRESPVYSNRLRVSC